MFSINRQIVGARPAILTAVAYLVLPYNRETKLLLRASQWLL